MSKQKMMKGMPPITDWLKKENLLEIKEETSEPKVKIDLKRTVRICLERIDKNINEVKILDQHKNIDIFRKKNLSQEVNTNVVDHTKKLRRSSRHLHSDEKNLQENSIVKEPNIKDLPPIIFEGCINYVSDFYDCANICDNLLNNIDNNKNVIPVGFDLEWPFNFQTGSGKTALAQICVSEKNCYLLHLYNIDKLPASFIALLSHPKIKLVGVNIKNDIWKLTRDFKEFPGQKVVTNNCLDCGPFANKIFNRSGRWSLERLTAYLLKKKINKDPSVRRSKWHIQPLSSAQKLYAATDAYVSLMLYLVIEKRREMLAQTKQGLEILEKEYES